MFGLTIKLCLSVCKTLYVTLHIVCNTHRLYSCGLVLGQLLDDPGAVLVARPGARLRGPVRDQTDGARLLLRLQLEIPVSS